MIQGPRGPNTTHSHTGIVAQNKQNKAALCRNVRWPLSTHREAGPHALVIHLSRRLGLDLRSWKRRQGTQKFPSHWMQQGTDSIVVVVVMMVVINQDGGHGHPYAVGTRAGLVIGLASCSWPWKVKCRKWGVWSDDAVGQALRTSATLRLVSSLAYLLETWTNLG